MRTILLLLLFPLFTLNLAAQVRTETVEARVIRVAGTGTAVGSPDLLQLFVGVISRDTSAFDGAQRNAQTVAKVITAVRAHLGPGSTVTSMSYELDPTYIFPREGGQPGLSGYIIRNYIRIESTDLTQVGVLIDAAMRSGATVISGISYTLRDHSMLRAEALKAASQQARRKGEALAAAMGVSLGSLRSIVENVGVNQGPVDAREQARDEEMPTSVRSGPVEARTDVILTFDIVK
jgi:uncharacterized protein YggE